MKGRISASKRISATFAKATISMQTTTEVLNKRAANVTRSQVSIEAHVGATEAMFQSLPDESERARMICDLTRLLRTPFLPEASRSAGLTLIGWLARRMPGEEAHELGVEEARAESECRIRSASRKAR